MTLRPQKRGSANTPSGWKWPLILFLLLWGGPCMRITDGRDEWTPEMWVGARNECCHLHGCVGWSPPSYRPLRWRVVDFHYGWEEWSRLYILFQVRYDALSLGKSSVSTVEMMDNTSARAERPANILSVWDCVPEALQTTGVTAVADCATNNGF